MAENKILEEWLDTDIIDRVVDMIIYTGIKELSRSVDKWPNEWDMYRQCIDELCHLDWFSLKANVRRTLK